MSFVEEGFNGSGILRSWFDPNRPTLSIFVKNGGHKKTEISQVVLEEKEYLETGVMPKLPIAQYHVSKLRAMGDS